MQARGRDTHLAAALCSHANCPEQKRLLQGSLPELSVHATEPSMPRFHLSQQQDDWAPGCQAPCFGNPLGRLPEGHPAIMQPCTEWDTTQSYVPSYCGFPLLRFANAVMSHVEKT